MESTLRILGCSGGFGAGLRTTSFLWDNDTLIDAGTGVGDLSLDELQQIDHIFLTHSHLDHLVSIPFLADAVGSKRNSPIRIYGLPETLAAFRDKIFHHDIWPDFTVIPRPDAPFIELVPIRAGEEIDLGKRSIAAIEVNHLVPAVGYLLKSAKGGHLAFSGDTTSCPSFWHHLEQTPDLRHVIVECSFRDQELGLAQLSKHFCPSLLAADLQGFLSKAVIHISHMKPGESGVVMHEIHRHAPNRCIELLQGKKLTF